MLNQTFNSTKPNVENSGRGRCGDVKCVRPGENFPSNCIVSGSSRSSGMKFYGPGECQCMP